MSLNIKSERVHELAREAARLTGKSQTSVVEEALEKLLAELGKPDPAEKKARIDFFLARVHARMTDETREYLRRAQDDLYDEMGLPK